MKRYSLLLLPLILIFTFMQSASAATVSDPPTGLATTAVSPTQVNLFWSAPTNNGGSTITGYKIEYKVGSGSYTVLVQNTAATSYSHTGLTTGQAYSYRIYAINAVGTSASSSESSVTPTSDSSGTYPGAPQNLSAIPVSPTQVNLFWSAPTNNGGYPITGYKIEYRIGSGSYQTLESNTANTATTYSHPGLATNQVYVYRVYAITSFGTSQNPTPESPNSVAQPKASSTLSVPTAPTSLTASAVLPTQINLSWSAPTSNGGAAITGYKIEVKSGSGSYTTLVSNTASTSTVYLHTGLTTGTTYTYKVSAINSVGASAASNEAFATPTSSSSSGVPGSPTGLAVTSASSTQIGLSWSAPTNNGGYPITGYKIEYKIGSDAYTTLVSNTGTTATTYTHTGLSAGQSYAYRVSAINSMGAGSPSTELTVTASSSSSSSSTPGSPASFTATATSTTQINLSWSAPTNNGGSAVTGYKIEVKKGSGSYEVLVSNTQSTSTSFSHTSLTAGTTYYYRVSAINSVGVGTPSEASATPQQTTTPALTAVAASPTSIALSWTAPSQTYNQAISGYRIEEKIGPGSYLAIIDNTASTGTTYTVNGLTTDSTHTYVVSARFTLGSSPRSNEASATPTATSTPPPPPPTSAPPASPTSLAATAVSPTQINLSWLTPSSTGGSAITGYKIEVKKGTGAFETLISSTTNSTTKYSHTHLTNGTAYTYRIYAINSAGLSSPSTEASATTQSSTSTQTQPQISTRPGKPALTVALASPTQVNLSWTAPSDTGDSQIIGYKIEYRIGSDPYRVLSSKALGTSYSHTGLLPNMYTYRIYAINSAGTGISSNEVTIKILQQTEQTPPTESTNPDASKCGVGTVLNDEGVCVVAEPEPQIEPEPAEPEPKTTHIPGFPDPNKDPQYYIGRYNNEPEYKAWFDKNFPEQTIYQVVGVPEPEPQPKTPCGAGTHLESGVCVLDDAKKNSPLSGCLIATATYGTELAPQVQQLREIREKTLLATNSGSTFLSAFNDVYYSFSPTVADWERQSPVLKDLVKVAITPMLSTLSVLNYVNIDSEQQMLGYGMGVILLNVGMYVGLPALFVLFVKNKLKTRHL